MAQAGVGSKILVVDDDAGTVELARLYLQRDGHTVLTSYDGTDALRTARETQPDLIVLDLMLPGIDGLELCRRLRRESQVLVIMLTARAAERDRLIGFDTGADDYLVKPFSPRELAARVRALLRRLPQESYLHGAPIIIHGSLCIDLTRHEVTESTRPVALTAVELRLLAVLARAPGRIFTRSQLVELIFGSGYDGLERSIDVHIFKLRRKLARAGGPEYIRSVYGVGYKFEETQR